VSAETEVVVDIRGLTKHYGEVKALTDLDLQVRRGEVFGYIGHNGAGKTTTIRILAGLLAPTRGQAHVAGIDATREPVPIRRLVGYLPDQFGVYDQMRVWEYLDFFGAAFRIPRKKRRDRLEEVLAITDSADLRDRHVDALSRGMKQRVGIARTLMHDPQVLLLDEPASGLDPRARVQMRQLLRRLADGGKTLIVSSHILPELAEVCDSVGIIHSGVLRASGPIEEVLAGLTRDRVMEVKALNGLDKARGILDAHPGCRDVKASEEMDNVLNVHFTGDDETLAAVLAELMGAGVQVATFREVPFSLEDAYMAVSGLDFGDADPAEDQPAQTPEAAATSDDSP